ncbi:hypothetical protein NE237_024986 [Protea cynaroides]|uniref:ZF-HD dimerization-type domain-containing protein n=1 Tax=Protea cynaroides TaxID=273540 RepID=A0A9Q0K0X6_9MAGN|nr:hypothetical protein NE237_024986 [Protea cynaroides]
MGNPKEEFVYGACMRNHAAKLGGHATDGCGEFTPTHGGFHCGACQCHQNFHQKIAVVANGGGTSGGDGKVDSSSRTERVETEVMEVSDGTQEEKQMRKVSVAQQQHEVMMQIRRGRRPRTKFTEEQTQMMFAFASDLGWKIKRDRSDEINWFCREIRVSRHVFKVWLNNHKHH